MPRKSAAALQLPTLEDPAPRLKPPPTLSASEAELFRRSRQWL